MNFLGLNLDSRKLAFILLFSALSLALYGFNFSQIIGADSQYFTLFQFIGPIGGGILGSAFGAVSVLLVELANFFLVGKEFELVNLVRLLPMVFAAVYFGSKKRSSAFVAIGAMLLFWIHPIGEQAWFYALYWVIPLAATFYRQNLFVRSLGTTFTAHAVGSVVFLYAFNLPAEVWIGLIPIVAFERLMFAAGISASYYVVNTILEVASWKVDLSFLNIENKYALVRA